MTTTPTDTVTPHQNPAIEGAPEAIARVAHEFVQAIRSEGNVNVVFGDPVTLDKHKIVPVALVEIGFGGGLGGSTNGNGLARRIGSIAQVVRNGFGAGGGGGIKITPIGFIHETSDRVQYHAITHGGSPSKKSRRT